MLNLKINIFSADHSTFQFILNKKIDDLFLSQEYLCFKATTTSTSTEIVVN
jgi:hypothetical protein